MKYFLIFIIIFSSLHAQNKSTEISPIFESCKEEPRHLLQKCFLNQVQKHVYQNFNNKDSISGTIYIKFLVDKQGSISPYFIEAPNQSLRTETERVFSTLPKVTPASYMNKPIEQHFLLNLVLPLQDPEIAVVDEQKIKKPFNKPFDEPLQEYDSIVYHPFDNPIFDSHLDIPFTHQNYAVFEPWMQKVGANNHTASKPYTYQEVSKYYDLKGAQEKLHKKADNWWAKKWWNENMVQIKGEGYWFTLDPIADLRLGRDFGSDINYTFVNTRGIRTQAGLGDKLHFYTTIYESQGRFADYYNEFASSIRPSGGNPAIIPGIGIAKEFKTNSFDFPLAEANITYTPSEFINLQLGYQRNFIGDGYRSMLLGDATTPYPFFKINTTFWKIKYTNLYTWLKDVRPEVTVDGTYATKFMSAHYLSWNVSKKLNLGFFESVVWGNDNDRGFDASFWNPIIFYRAVEFNASSRSGNALLGLTGKYKWNNRLHFYGQFLVDEFSFGDVREGNQSWTNKFAHQIGVKYFEPFDVENLTLQLEYNTVRPYVYSHSSPITNYGHNNQSLGHPWGGNLKELIFIGRYFKDRWFADLRCHFGVRGLDFNTVEDSFNYGGNIYINYNDDRPFDTNVKIGQGNRTSIFLADLQVGYTVNPATNLKIFTNLIYRDFTPSVVTDQVNKTSTTWLSIGFRTDLFNWYFDY